MIIGPNRYVYTVAISYMFKNESNKCSFPRCATHRRVIYLEKICAKTQLFAQYIYKSRIYRGSIRKMEKRSWHCLFKMFSSPVSNILFVTDSVLTTGWFLCLCKKPIAISTRESARGKEVFAMAVVPSRPARPWESIWLTVFIIHNRAAGGWYIHFYTSW